MHPHGAFGDRETQSSTTTTLPITRVFGAIEGLKNPFE
jgi:hypothetical protein